MIWRKLKPGDVIVCPSNGRLEVVTRIDRKVRPNGKIFVRTSYHDHLRAPNGPVTVHDVHKSVVP